MYQDTQLRLATAEVVPNAGAAPGGIGPDLAAAPYLPHGGIEGFLENAGDLAKASALAVSFDIDTAYESDTYGSTLEFQVVSLPIEASLLDAATGTGQSLSIASVTLTDSTDAATIVGHGLPLGAPVYLTALNLTTGVADNVTYWVIPIDADNFQLAASQADALAGTELPLTTNGTATVNFMPVVHASSGSIGIYGTEGVLSSVDHGFQIKFNPLQSGPGKSVKPTIHAATPGTEDKQAFGSGPLPSVVAAAAHRHYYLRYVPAGGVVTAGAVTVDLIYDASSSPQHHASGYEVI